MTGERHDGARVAAGLLPGRPVVQLDGAAGNVGRLVAEDADAATGGTGVNLTLKDKHVGGPVFRDRDAELGAKVDHLPLRRQHLEAAGRLRHASGQSAAQQTGAVTRKQFQSRRPFEDDTVPAEEAYFRQAALDVQDRARRIGPAGSVSCHWQF